MRRHKSDTQVLYGTLMSSMLATGVVMIMDFRAKGELNFVCVGSSSSINTPENSYPTLFYFSLFKNLLYRYFFNNAVINYKQIL